MFNVNYQPDPDDPSTGTIVSYQEGADRDSNVAPEGCKTLSFPYQVKGMFNEHGMCLMKIQNGKLVWADPVDIPDPLPNPANAA